MNLKDGLKFELGNEAVILINLRRNICLGKIKPGGNIT